MSGYKHILGPTVSVTIHEPVVAITLKTEPTVSVYIPYFVTSSAMVKLDGEDATMNGEEITMGEQ